MPGAKTSPDKKTETFYSPDGSAPQTGPIPNVKPLPAARQRLEDAKRTRKSAAKSGLRPLGGEAQVDKPRKNLTADLALGDGFNPNEVDADTLRRDIERIRSLGRPFGALTQKLAVPPIPGYYQHWFNDDPGRVQEMLDRGWTNVLGRDKKPVRRIVGRGRDSSGLYAYLLKIPQVFREEEMERRHAEANARMAEMKKNPFKAPKGLAKASDQGKFYSAKEDEPLRVREEQAA